MRGWKKVAAPPVPTSLVVDYVRGTRRFLIKHRSLERDAADVTDDLLEWDYGIFEGQTTQEIRQKQSDWSIWTTSVVQGESIEQVGYRAQRVIQRAVTAGGSVLLFAHAHILRILTACWLGLPVEAGRLFVLGTASISVLGYERETRVIYSWNLSCEVQR